MREKPIAAMFLLVVLHFGPPSSLEQTVGGPRNVYKIFAEASMNAAHFGSFFESNWET